MEFGMGWGMGERPCEERTDAVPNFSNRLTLQLSHFSPHPPCLLSVYLHRFGAAKSDASPKMSDEDEGLALSSPLAALASARKQVWRAVYGLDAPDRSHLGT